jgi:RecA/RadA recombinase
MMARQAESSCRRAVAIYGPTSSGKTALSLDVLMCPSGD